MTSDVDVAVIGGGFSGTMAAVQLGRRGLKAALIDGSGRMGRGIAYSTREPAHVLNVRAEVMHTKSLAKGGRLNTGMTTDTFSSREPPRPVHSRYCNAVVSAFDPLQTFGL